MTGIAQYEFLVALIAIILVLEAFAHAWHLPQAAVLIVGGSALALVPGMPQIEPDPELVLAIFLPPLLMSGAFRTVWRDFRDNMAGILLLAVGAVGFTTLIVGLAVHYVLPSMPWAVCFAIGAVVSPPDAVAADAVLARVRLPSRIIALLQGESLLNDAAGLVLLRFAIAAALTGTFSLTQALEQFSILSVGGVVLGYALGQGGRIVVRRLPESRHAIAATVLITAIAYVGAERLHFSGVLATVTAGLTLGWHQHRDFSATLRVRAFAFWDVLVFIMESLLFILIGLSLRGVINHVTSVEDALHTLLLPAATVVAATVVARFIWVFASDIVLRVMQAIGLRHHSAPSFAAATVMGWAGMRGVVTLLAALSLPETLPGRDVALVSAFGIIVASVLVQGSTLGALIRWLKLDSAEEARAQREAEAHAWVSMADAQYAAIARMGAEHPRLMEQYRYRAMMAAEARDAPDASRTHEIAHFAALLAAISAGRGTILHLHRAGRIPDTVLREMEYELDLQQMVAEARLAEPG
jgi:monovalent cation/hydrogen antiporter